MKVIGGEAHLAQRLADIGDEVEDIRSVSGQTALVDNLFEVDAPALEDLDDLHHIHIAHHIAEVTVLLALIVEHGPELDGSNGLDEPHDG